MVTARHFAIRSAADVTALRQWLREVAATRGLSPLKHTKLTTAALELARNILRHAGSGRVEAQLLVRPDSRPTLALSFVDEGPGIPDPAWALADGNSSGGGLGLGLGGAARLVDRFTIREGEVGGTIVEIEVAL